VKERIADVLLVEDNPDDLELALHAFKQNQIGDRIQVARDGAEALELLFAAADTESHLPRVVLLDMKLPKVDGLEVLRRVRADPRTRRLPIVMLTASAQEHEIIESYELGVNSYIVKPVEFKRFSETVGQLGLYWLALNQPVPEV
jgi:two-component system, response regulator